MKRFTISQKGFISLMLMILLAVFFLAPMHVLSHGVWGSRSYGSAAVVSATTTHFGPGSSAYSCFVCRTFNPSLFHSTLPGSIVRLPCAAGLLEETSAAIKSVDPLDWQLNRAPPLW